VDRAQLLQVLMNLAINARDAMPTGGTLRLQTARRGEMAELVVSDTGAGIAPEHLPHIFEPFYTTKAVGEGTGLGLATVHGIVRQSQGDVTVESRPGQGARFRLVFPLTDDPVAAAAPSRPPARVLLVDDDESVRRALGWMLASDGCEVMQAADGGAALSCLERMRGALDLVVSDVMMPVLAGPELADRFASEYPTLPVLWISGHSDGEFAAAAAARGQTVLRKPVGREALLTEVRALLDRNRAGTPEPAAP
jgi:two-component system, cell cycle sensor histidine kinase and response regulator CckA